MTIHRNYKKEYRQYYGSVQHLNATQKKHRLDKTSRNKARAIIRKKTGVSKTEDVDHIDHNPRNNNPSNLRKRSIHSNRADNKKKT